METVSPFLGKFWPSPVIITRTRISKRDPEVNVSVWRLMLTRRDSLDSNTHVDS